MCFTGKSTGLGNLIVEGRSVHEVELEGFLLFLCLVACVYYEKLKGGKRAEADL